MHCPLHHALNSNNNNNNNKNKNKNNSNNNNTNNNTNTSYNPVVYDLRVTVFMSFLKVMFLYHVQDSVDTARAASERNSIVLCRRWAELANDPGGKENRGENGG